MGDLVKAALYGLPAMAFAVVLAAWAERRFGLGRRKRAKP
jgi:hypothetical protein